jgi:hypothetical protein
MATTDPTCGTCRPPADDTPEREVIDVFADFLREAGAAGVNPRDPLPDTTAARAFARRWGPYMRGEASGPADTAP